MTEPIRCQVLATDYDGTLTGGDESVTTAVLDGLRRLKASGRLLVLVTGRELDDLYRVFPAAGIFDGIVAENGAVFHRPSSGEVQVLADPPAGALIQRLREDKVTPLAVGNVIVATRAVHAPAVVDAIRDLQLDLQVIFNKDSVMVLPPGIDKASGLRRALADLGSPDGDVLGIGDAENDHALLGACGCGVAVANAHPALRERAHLVTAASGGDGVLEVIDAILATR